MLVLSGKTLHSILLDSGESSPPLKKGGRVMSDDLMSELTQYIYV